MKSSRKPARRRATIGINPLDTVPAAPMETSARTRRRPRRGIGALVGGLLLGFAVFCLFVL